MNKLIAPAIIAVAAVLSTAALTQTPAPTFQNKRYFTTPLESDAVIVDARDFVLTPGLISTHAHIGGSPLDRSFIEDRGNPQFYYSGLFELLPVRGAAQTLLRREFQLRADEALLHAGTTAVSFELEPAVRGPERGHVARQHLQLLA